MSFQIDCPNCGCRPVWEYHYGGTPRQRPDGSATEREWAEYLYNRPNIAGEQTEWWYHRSACKLWFLVRRDTRTNQVLETKRFAAQAEASGGLEPTAATLSTESKSLQSREAKKDR